MGPDQATGAVFFFFFFFSSLLLVSHKETLHKTIDNSSISGRRRRTKKKKKKKEKKKKERKITFKKTMSSPPPSPSSSPSTVRGNYIHPSLASSPKESPASSPPSSPVASKAPRQNTDSAVSDSYGPASSGTRKRKASWSLYNLLPKRFRPDEEEEIEEEETDVVNLVLQDNFEGLRKVVAKPDPMPFLEDRPDGVTSLEERKDAAQNNPLYVAALINRVEAARLLLANGWRMAEDRSMIRREDPYTKGFTPLGVAFEKKNGVLEVFREHLVSLEEKYWSEESKKKRRQKEEEKKEGEATTTLKVAGGKRLKRSNSRGHFELSMSASVVAHNPAGVTTNSNDLVDLVLEDNVEELEKKVQAPAMLDLEEEGRVLSIEERDDRASENPLFVAAKIGREKAAEVLLGAGWKMTEDRTRRGVDDLYMEGLTPLGVAYEKNFGVLDLFLNKVIDLEEEC